MSTTVAQLNGLFYEKYADKIETLYQRIAILKDDVPFVPASKQSGGNYNQPVVMSPEQGFTYAAPAAAGPVAMNDAVSLVMQNAQVTPFQMGARFVLDYESANRSVAAKAFEPAALLQMTNVLEQAHNRLEHSMLYGQEGLGDSTATTGIDATTCDVTFSAASWSDAIWGTALNSRVQFFDTATGALISSGADSTPTRRSRPSPTALGCRPRCATRCLAPRRSSPTPARSSTSTHRCTTCGAATATLRPAH